MHQRVCTRRVGDEGLAGSHSGREGAPVECHSRTGGESGAAIGAIVSPSAQGGQR